MTDKDCERSASGQEEPPQAVRSRNRLQRRKVCLQAADVEARWCLLAGLGDDVWRQEAIEHASGRRDAVFGNGGPGDCSDHPPSAHLYADVVVSHTDNAMSL